MKLLRNCSESAKTAESDTEASSQSVNKQHTQLHDKSSDKTLVESNTNKNDEETQNDVKSSEWHEVSDLVKSAMIRGVRCYFVKWKGKRKNLWEPHTNISPFLIREFHVKKTLSGKRKRQVSKMPHNI